MKKPHLICCYGRRGEHRELCRRAIRAVLAAEGVDEPCEVGVLFTDDEGIREFNRERRGVDSATDVLSFPLNEFIPGAFASAGAERNLDTGRIMLGDMVISLERCAAQGEEYGHGFHRELCYLAAHSALHLLGYDHLDEGEQKKAMRAREEIVMKGLELER